MPASHFIAVDIGNARIKLGLFVADCAEGIPEPLQTLSLVGDAAELDAIVPWLDAAGALSLRQWWIASVNRHAASALVQWLRERRPQERVILLASGDLPLTVRLERPDMVGIDRLVDAVAVNRLRDGNRPAVIVDVGTAITVDLVSAEGCFMGGAILPGTQMSARAMHEFTDMLPLIDVSDLIAPPPALGTDTAAAMQSGLFWGTVGAVRQLIEQLTAPASPPPQVFLTGGAGAAVADLLQTEAWHVPHLTLAGIALAAKELTSAAQPTAEPNIRRA